MQGKRSKRRLLYGITTGPIPVRLVAFGSVVRLPFVVAMALPAVRPPVEATAPYRQQRHRAERAGCRWVECWRVRLRLIPAEVTIGRCGGHTIGAMTGRVAPGKSLGKVTLMSLGEFVLRPHEAVL